MKMTSTPLSEARIKRHRQWITDWSEGLGYCLNCAEEYTDQETVIINGEKIARTAKLITKNKITTAKITVVLTTIASGNDSTMGMGIRRKDGVWMETLGTNIGFS